MAAQPVLHKLPQTARYTPAVQPRHRKQIEASHQQVGTGKPQPEIAVSCRTVHPGKHCPGKQQIDGRARCRQQQLPPRRKQHPAHRKAKPRQGSFQGRQPVLQSNKHHDMAALMKQRAQNAQPEHSGGIYGQQQSIEKQQRTGRFHPQVQFRQDPAPGWGRSGCPRAAAQSGGGAR